MFGWGTGAMAFAVLALRRGRAPTTSPAFWEYFSAPVFQLICVQSILLAGSFILMGNLHGNELMPPAIVGIVLPSMVLFVITFSLAVEAL